MTQFSPHQRKTQAPFSPGLQADALFSEAVAHHKRNDPARALMMYEQLLQASPDHAAAVMYKGVAQRQLGRGDDAVATLVDAHARWPGHPEILINLATTYLETGQLEKAAGGFARAVELDPTSLQAQANLAATYRRLGRFDDAVTALAAAVKLAPGQVGLSHSLGLLLADLKRYDEAHAVFEAARVQDPENCQTHFHLGQVFTVLDRHEEALDHFRRAQELDPAQPAPFVAMGHLLLMQKRKEESAAAYEKAVALGSPDPRPRIKLASLRIEEKAFDVGKELLHHALKLAPDNREGLLQLAKAHYMTAEIEDAVAVYERLAAHEHDDLASTVHAHLILPWVVEDDADIETWRARYKQGLDALGRQSEKTGEPNSEVNPLAFYLAYHNRCDRALMEQLAVTLGQLSPYLRPDAARVPLTCPRLGRSGVPVRKTRVAFVSENLSNHTVGELYGGLIGAMQKIRFDVSIFHLPGTAESPHQDRINKGAAHYETLPEGIEEQRRVIREAQPDVVFFPDIGMSSPTYYLACDRMAPVQVVGYGHPDTTGLASIDYFLSCRLNEPEGAAAHYCERLIQTSRIPWYYLSPRLPDPMPGRAELGLDPDQFLYACPQSIFKLHPDFDHALEDIARGHEEAGFVFLDSPWAGRLKARWQRTAPTLKDRATFLPKLSWKKYMGLIDSVDVLLDPIHYSTGKSMYESMAVGTAVVTWPGRFMRARTAYGVYRQLGVDGVPIAENQADYAETALALGRDPERRARLKAELPAAARRHLFEDAKAVREFEAFLEAAVDAAAEDTLLDQDWTWSETHP